MLDIDFIKISNNIFQHLHIIEYMYFVPGKVATISERPLYKWPLYPEYTVYVYIYINIYIFIYKYIYIYIYIYIIQENLQFTKVLCRQYTFYLDLMNYIDV